MKVSKIMKKLFLISVVLSIAAISGATLIDDFTSVQDEGQGWTVALGSDAGNPADVTDSVTIVDAGLGDALGGTRSITTYAIPNTYIFGSTPYTTNAGVSANLDTNESDGRQGFYSLSSNWGGKGKFEIVYDRGGEGLNIDLSSGTNISVSFSADHLGNSEPSALSLTLADALGNVETVSYQWDSYTLLPEKWNEFEFNFADYDVDVSNLDSITVGYVADLANNVSVDFIATDAVAEASPPVPEPATIALLGLGCLVMTRGKRA